MIAVDVGSKLVKWFDGSSFGTGIPANLKNAVVGVSSKNVFVKESFYPVCKSAALKKLIVNDVCSDMLVSPDDISVAFCVVEKLNKGCRVLVFVEKKGSLEEKKLTDNYKILTLDLIGGINAAHLLYEGDEFSLLDIGASKVAVVNFRDGNVVNMEVFRVGFDFLKKNNSYLTDRVFPLIESKSVILCGGGALDEQLVGLVSTRFDVEIPEISPFGKETPLYFNAYGLFHIKKSPCPAFFSQSSFFKSDFLEKHKKEIIFAGTSTAAGVLLLLLSQGVQLLACKDFLKREETILKSKLEKILGEKVVAPDIQLSQAISNLKEEKKFFAVDKPSVLTVLKKISDSVVSGIKVYRVEGSVDADSFTVKGYADTENSFTSFVNNLKERFENVSNVSTTSTSNNSLKFTLTVSGVKRET
ncbi:hypothetical protein SAMN06265339_1239 [Desulfurobacterium pacificum]|uniref:RNA-directed RNA polymerase n=2 Tax=Desulfurobacterium pacificum TaxID=240166 RepID=A0ABY1NP79_9BACT|nr:hypothetical protein SAMN06265339_1239 [Desulfurobacterium pacificum]